MLIFLYLPCLSHSITQSLLRMLSTATEEQRNSMLLKSKKKWSASSPPKSMECKTAVLSWPFLFFHLKTVWMYLTTKFLSSMDFFLLYLFGLWVVVISFSIVLYQTVSVHVPGSLPLVHNRLIASLILLKPIATSSFSLPFALQSHMGLSPSSLMCSAPSSPFSI